jgi:hypothetical protein
MTTSYNGRVVIDDDENHPWTVNIDDLDQPNWVVIHPARSPGAWIPVDGATVRVTLTGGPRVTQQAVARFRGTPDIWLEGVSVFAPAS